MRERESVLREIGHAASIKLIRPELLVARGGKLDAATSVAGLARSLGFLERRVLSPDRQDLYNALEKRIGMPGVTEVTDLSPEAIAGGNRIFAVRYDGNPTGTKWDNVYYKLLREMEEWGLLTPNVSRVIEGTSAGAGPSLAWAGRQLGYRVTIVLPADIPAERAQIILDYAGEVVRSEWNTYAVGNIKTIKEYMEQETTVLGGKVGQNPQRTVPAVKTNRETRKPYSEIAQHSSDDILQRAGRVPDIWVALVGSGATASGIGEYVRSSNPQGLMFAVADAENPALHYLSEGQVYNQVFTPNILGSISPGVSADHQNINWNVIHGIIDVTLKESVESLQNLHQGGLLVGETSGAEFAAVRKVARAVRNKMIVFNCNDSIRNYNIAI